MAFNQRIAFEVDAGSAGASDNNGGGFDDVTGTPGTNYVWPTPTIIAYTDLTSVGAGSTIGSTLRAFIAADVGNVLNVTGTGGGNLTTGRYQILSVAGGIATLDRAISTGATVTGTGNLGGALLTIQKGIDAAFTNTGAVADCRVYVKKAAYTGTIALISGTIGGTKYRNRVIGYFATHDDDPTVASGNQPTYAVGSGAGVQGYTNTVLGMTLQNLTLVGTATSGTKGTKGITTSVQFFTLWNCKVTDFSAEGFETTGSGDVGVKQCEFTLCGGTTPSVVGAAGASGVTTFAFCYIHKCTKTALLIGTNGSATGCLIANSSGASSDGIQANTGANITGCTIYGFPRDGIRFVNAADPAVAPNVSNNIIAKCLGVGINAATAGALPALIRQIDYNGFYANGSNYANITAGPHDVAISANPFNSSDADLAAETNPDWGLNATASAGASFRGAGYPGNLPGLSTSTGYRDLGAFQHADPSPTAGGVRVVGGFVAG